VLQKTISATRAETWEQINRTLLTSAREMKIERGRLVRLDSTVTAAPVHEPSDGSLLWDAVRVMVRLLQQANAWLGRAALGVARSSSRRRRSALGTSSSREVDPGGSAVSRADQSHAGHLGLCSRPRRSWP
jgi:IS5 family transposase